MERYRCSSASSFSFHTMFSSLHKTIFNFLFAFILLPANGVHVDQSDFIINFGNRFTPLMCSISAKQTKDQTVDFCVI